MKIPTLKLTTLLLSCFSFVWFGSLTAFAQDQPLKFERFTTENGLSSNIIYSIIQDKKGFLWLGTHEGLCRFDGYNFKSFRHNPSDSSSLPANQINSICEDSEGNIWAATPVGLYRYNYSKNNFSFVPINSSGAGNIDQVMVANKDELIVYMSYSGHDKLQLLNIHTLQSVSLAHQTHGLASFFPLDLNKPLVRDARGKIYLAGMDYYKSHNRVIYQFDEKKRIFLDYLDFPFLKKKPDEYINQFAIDSHDSWWLGTSYRQLIRFSSAKCPNEFINILPGQKNQTQILDFHEDHEGNFWIATRNGILVYDPSTRRFNQSSYDPIIKAIGNNEVCTIFQDNTGVIWIGSFTGLYKLNPVLKKFEHFTSSADSRVRLINNSVMGIRLSSGSTAWVLYLNSLKYSLLNCKDGSIHSYPSENYTDEYLKYLYNNHDKISKDSLDTYLSEYEKVDNPRQIFNRQKWLFSIINVCFGKLIPSGVFHSTVIDFTRNAHEYWFATDSEGLFRIRKSSGEITRFLATGKENTLSSNLLTNILLEENGNLWIGTNGGGLNYFNSQTNSFMHYTTAEGLPHNSVYNLVKDDKGRLWLGTGNGLSCLDLLTHKFKNFFRTDGLVNAEFNRYSACRLSNGYLLMGGMDGIDYFHPDSILSNETKIQVQITDFKVFNKDIPVQSKIFLEHDQNYVTLSFAAMDFRNVAGNHFAYKLEGIDKDWILANQNSISYAMLSHGHYHFLVKAAGGHGDWNNIPAEIYFTIATPWWKASWFLLLSGIFILAILYSIYHFRINQLKKVFAVRTKISQDLHDEVGATLTSISYLSEVVKKQTGNGVSPAHEQIEKIGEFSRDMIGEMNDIVWAINPANDKFEKIEDHMQNFAYTLLSAKNIQFYFRADEQVKNILLGMQQRKNLYLIFKEAVNNAAKYADCSTVHVNLYKEDHQVHLNISDDGKGFILAERAPGNGLRNMEARAIEINGKIIIESQPGKGTSISLTMPITQNAY